MIQSPNRFVLHRNGCLKKHQFHCCVIFFLTTNPLCGIKTEGAFVCPIRVKSGKTDSKHKIHLVGSYVQFIVFPMRSREVGGRLWRSSVEGAKCRETVLSNMHNQDARPLDVQPLRGTKTSR
jgi:hypothetical protein